MRDALKNDGAFTTVELLIVVGIIGVLVAVAVPRFFAVLEKAREGATKGSISAIRGATRIYFGDHEMCWPETLATSAASSFSQYLDILPSVACRHPSNTRRGPSGDGVTYLPREARPEGFGRGWAYDRLTGNVFINSVARDSRGESYTVY